MNGNLTCLSRESETLDTHDVTDVEKFLENGVVHGFVLTWTNLVTLNIYLNSA